jgi:hypothetical protein
MLILNDHCQVCEFRQRCCNQAMQEDNLSLLREFSEKIKSYNRKASSLSPSLLTFRPRRKGKEKNGERTTAPALQTSNADKGLLRSTGTPNSPVCVC